MITAKDARWLKKEYDENKAVKVPGRIYNYIRRSASRGKTEIEIGKLDNDRCEILRKNGFHVAAKCSRPNVWNRTVIAWEKPPYNEPPKPIER